MNTPNEQPEKAGQRPVAIWLWLCVSVLWAMIVLGGVVRLTRSGLSITVWEPIVGAIPPLGEAEWERVYALYRQSPEFRHVNPTMDLSGFKAIFWPEYLHRLLARGIGVIIVGPCAYFLWRGWLSRRLVRYLGVLLLLGGLQGLVGWLMVASGLGEVAQVSHYRLTAHLGLGVLIFAFAFWIAMETSFAGYLVSDERPALTRATKALTALTSITVLSGGLVAGLKAGHAYPTFPLIAGKLIPDGLWAATPAWRNFVDNALTVQFQHRVLGAVVLIAVVALAWAVRRAGAPRHARVAFDLMLAVAVVQVGLGILALVLRVPVAVAAAHQGNAALLLASSLHALHALRRRPPHVEPSQGAAPAADAPAPVLSHSEV